eukprot:GFUD01002753.1.p1 GENE.GFUD01002753.1~~GFUD01002753.1.p1  ORF type:complete len:217 (-),score=49.05 GFUD01002753.1:29-679(-)
MPVSCYLCGRDFGSRSIAIHVPNCAKRWEDEQRILPKSQRRPLPPGPDNLDRVMAGQLDGEELKTFNRSAVKQWNEAVLVSCSHCKRTFLPGKLAKHQKACTKDKPMGNPNSVKGKASKLEALMNYSALKKSEQKSGNLGEESESQTGNCCCKLPDISKNTENNQETSQELAQPTLQDFMDNIEDSKILHNKELSSQLYFWMSYFIKMKMQNNIDE